MFWNHLTPKDCFTASRIARGDIGTRGNLKDWPVSAEDIQAAARDIFSPEKLNLAVIGPDDNRQRFEKLLENAL